VVVTWTGSEGVDVALRKPAARSRSRLLRMRNGARAIALRLAAFLPIPAKARARFVPGNKKGRRANQQH
jgi:hypothetical protein